MEILHFKLCGQFQVLSSEGRVCTPTGRKECGVLAVLVLADGEPVSRQWLREALWSDRSAEQQKTSLRQCLARLRKALGAHRELIVGNAHEIRLDISAVILDSVPPIDDLHSTSNPENLFLCGFHIRDTLFNEWLTAARRKLWLRCRDELSQQPDSAKPAASDTVCDDPSAQPMPSMAGRHQAGVGLDAVSAIAWRHTDDAAGAHGDTKSLPVLPVLSLFVLPTVGASVNSSPDTLAHYVAEVVSEAVLSSGITAVKRHFDSALGHDAPDLSPLSLQDSGSRYSVYIKALVFNELVLLRCCLLCSQTRAQLWQHEIRLGGSQWRPDDHKIAACAYELVEALIIEAVRPPSEQQLLSTATARTLKGLLVPGSSSAEDMLSDTDFLVTQSSSGLVDALRASALGYLVGERHAVDEASLLEEMQTNLRRALQQDPHNPLVLTFVGHFYGFLLDRTATGLELTERAVKQAPHMPLAHALYSSALQYAGKTDESYGHALKAWELGRHTIGRPFYGTVLANTALVMGKITESVAYAEEVVTSIGWFRPVMDTLIVGYNDQGRDNKVREVVDQLRMKDNAFNLDLVQSSQYPVRCDFTRSGLIEALQRLN